MQVYIVEHWIHYEGMRINSVHSNIESAKKALRELVVNCEHLGSYWEYKLAPDCLSASRAGDHYEIQEHEVVT